MNRPLALGCAVVFLLFAAVVVVGVMQAPKLFRKGAAFVMQTVADEARLTALEKAWQPPSTSPDEQWFPKTVGNWTRESSEPVSDFHELDIPRPGYHATYRSSAGPITVDVVQVNDSNQEGLITRAEKALENRQSVNTNVGGLHVTVNSGGSQMTTSSGNRKHVRINGDEHTRFWWLKGTLFIFRARGAADSEAFPEEYLRTISPTTPPAEPKLERP